MSDEEDPPTTAGPIVGFFWTLCAPFVMLINGAQNCVRRRVGQKRIDPRTGRKY